MRRVSILVPAVALSLVCLLPRTVLAQNKPAVENRDQGYHKMEIYNGPMRTVAYFANGMLTGDQTALRDLQRAENDVAMSDLIQQIRMQYLIGEANLEARRQVVNPLLYGYSAESTSSMYTASLFGSSPYNGLYGYGNGYGNGYGYGSPNGGGYVMGSTGKAVYSLANGVGNEGTIKTDLAKSFLPEASAEYRVKLGQSLERALAVAGDSDSLRSKMGIQQAAAGSGNADVVTLKDGTTVSGTVTKEDNDWVVVKTVMGKNTREEKVRTSEVVRISKADKGVRPASN